MSSGDTGLLRACHGHSDVRLSNRQGLAEFDCEPDHPHRAPGLSGLVRLRDEEVWCGLALKSFVGWCDELVVVLNACTDSTPDIVHEFRDGHPDKVRVFSYPFSIHPMGPGHNSCPADSLHASSYMHNFAQAMSTRTHVVKLDGDMVMMDWAGEEIRNLMAQGHQRIKFEGRDLVGDDLRHVGNHPQCPTNGVYPVLPGVHYAQGPMTQNLKGAPDPTHRIHDPAFLHFKWSRKSFQSATVQWPAGWETIPHFQRIANRRFPVADYDGSYPSSVRALL